MQRPWGAWSSDGALRVNFLTQGAEMEPTQKDSEHLERSLSDLQAAAGQIPWGRAHTCTSLPPPHTHIRMHTHNQYMGQ